MNLFKLPFRLIGGLWRLAMQIRSPLGSDLRRGSAAAGLYTFLFLLFALVAVIARSLGISLESIDRWIEYNSGWIEALGDLLFRVVCTVAFLMSAAICLTTLAGVFQALRGPGSPLEASTREESADEAAEEIGPLGRGCGFLIALTVSYFAWDGITG